MTNRLIEIQIFHLFLPFRQKFSHAAATRSGTDTVVVAALLSDGTVGYGEGVPREYVTGETVDSMIYNINDTLIPLLEKLEPKKYADLLDFVDQLPFTNSVGQCINCARCAIELALLDAYGKHFHSSVSTVGGWMGYGPFTRGGSLKDIRVSGILDGSSPKKIKRRLQLMRWFGLRDFKLKMGRPDDNKNLELVYETLKKSLLINRGSLRIDANGAWDIDTATAMCEKLSRYHVCCVEQPLSVDDRSHFHTLASLSPLPLMADESLINLEDGEFLAENDLTDYFNIRISKNGGLLPSLRLAGLAHSYSLDYQLGAMVGESGILAAAGLHFLQLVPDVAFTEICYSTFLLQSDIVKERMSFSIGGRLKALKRTGMGIELLPTRLALFSRKAPGKINLT